MLSNNHLQLQIRSIAESAIDFDQKLIQLRELLTHEWIMYLSDFDDTITSNESIIFSRYHLLRYLKLEQDIGGLIESSAINPDFLYILSTHKDIQRIVIVSRNNLSVLEAFMDSHLAWELGIEIVGAIGSIPGLFELQSYNKIPLLSPDSRIIGDIYECSVLQKDPRFIKVSSIGFFRKRIIFLKKLTHFSYFLVKKLLLKASTYVS
jgi:hypothetical protein